MKTINVNRKKLMDVVRGNLAAHIKEYTDMMEEYKKELIPQLQTLVVDAQNSTKNFKKTIYLKEPQNHEKAYSKILSMLSMSVDEVIILDSREYDKYVMNEWEWSHEFAQAKTAYYKGL